MSEDGCGSLMSKNGCRSLMSRKECRRPMSKHDVENCPGVDLEDWIPERLMSKHDVEGRMNAEEGCIPKTH